jgi:hypothetical protein
MLEMRTSERDSLKKCAQQWYWSQVEGLEPVRAANPLWFGSAVHEALADWYLPGKARGPHPAETFTKVLEGERQMIVGSEEQEAEYVDARELGVDMLTRYVDEYGQDPTWNVVATERKLSVIIPRPKRKLFGTEIPSLKRWLRYRMTWDGIFRDETTGELWLMEHKTAASIMLEHLPLDDQAGSYWALATQLLRKSGDLRPDEEIAGIRYNFLRKAMADQRPRNELGQYTNLPKKQHYVDALINHFGEDAAPGEMEEWEADLPKMTLVQLQDVAKEQRLHVVGDPSASQPPRYFERHDVYRSPDERQKMIRRIQDEAFYAEGYRSGDLPITKAPDKQRCRWCPFERMCQLDESGDRYAVEEFKQTQFKVRDPYGVYRKGA